MPSSSPPSAGKSLCRGVKQALFAPVLPFGCVSGVETALFAPVPLLGHREKSVNLSLRESEYLGNLFVIGREFRFHPVGGFHSFFKRQRSDAFDSKPIGYDSKDVVVGEEDTFAYPSGGFNIGFFLSGQVLEELIGRDEKILCTRIIYKTEPGNHPALDSISIRKADIVGMAKLPLCFICELDVWLSLRVVCDIRVEEQVGAAPSVAQGSGVPMCDVRIPGNIEYGVPKMPEIRNGLYLNVPGPQAPSFSVQECQYLFS